MLSGVSFFNNAANFWDFNKKNKLISINYNWNNCSKTETPHIIEKNQRNQNNLFYSIFTGKYRIKKINIMTQTPVINPMDARNDGTWSVQDEKLRISYENGQESVLFEDTASISYECHYSSTPNGLFAGLGFVIGIILLIATDAEDFGIAIDFGCIILGVWMAYQNPIVNSYDNVAIETRGGKIICFSVAYQQGQGIMEQIEAEKRKWESAKK